MISGNDVDSQQVEEARLAAESAYAQKCKTATKRLTSATRVTQNVFKALLVRARERCSTIHVLSIPERQCLLQLMTHSTVSQEDSY